MTDRVNTNPHIISFVLSANRYFPNNKLPVIIYKKVLQLPDQKNKAAEIAQKLLVRNGWSNSWKNGIYDFHHYHSNTHECLIICMGWASVVLGGPMGKRLKIKRGDVIVLPAGAGHKCTRHSDDFLCVGAYPQGKDYDINKGTQEEYKKALPRISKLSIPKQDPISGKNGFLKTFWK